MCNETLNPLVRPLVQECARYNAMCASWRQVGSPIVERGSSTTSLSLSVYCV